MKAKRLIGLSRGEIKRTRDNTRMEALAKIRKNVSVGWASQRLAKLERQLAPFVEEYQILVNKLRKNTKEKERLNFLKRNIHFLEEQCEICEELIDDLAKQGKR